jgi:transcriptional accessory protein Tex/SPT6
MVGRCALRAREEMVQIETASETRDLTPEELKEAIEASLKLFNEGDILEGTVVRIDRDEVLLDIGYKSEGVIPTKELSIRHDVDPSQVVKVGDQVEALVLQKEDKEGRLILSKKRAQYERAWGRIEEVMQSGGTIKGPVIEVVKGGLILDIGLRGFLPASLVDLRRVRDLHPFVGTELEAKIIELDRNRNNVVLSRRAFLEESQSEGRKKFLESLQKACRSRLRRPRRTPGRSSSASTRRARSSTARSPSSSRSARSCAWPRASRAWFTSPRSRTSTSRRPRACFRWARRSASR